MAQNLYLCVQLTVGTDFTIEKRGNEIFLDNCPQNEIHTRDRTTNNLNSLKKIFILTNKMKSRLDKRRKVNTFDLLSHFNRIYHFLGENDKTTKEWGYVLCLFCTFPKQFLVSMKNSSEMFEKN